MKVNELVTIQYTQQKQISAHQGQTHMFAKAASFDGLPPSPLITPFLGKKYQESDSGSHPISQIDLWHTRTKADTGKNSNGIAQAIGPKEHPGCTHPKEGTSTGCFTQSFSYSPMARPSNRSLRPS